MKARQISTMLCQFNQRRKLQVEILGISGRGQHTEVCQAFWISRGGVLNASCQKLESYDSSLYRLGCFNEILSFLKDTGHLSELFSWDPFNSIPMHLRCSMNNLERHAEGLRQQQCDRGGGCRASTARITVRGLAGLHILHSSEGWLR